MSAESPRNDVSMVSMNGGEITIVSGKWGDDKGENQDLEIGLLLANLGRFLPDYGEDVPAGKPGDNNRRND